MNAYGCQTPASIPRAYSRGAKVVPEKFATASRFPLVPSPSGEADGKKNPLCAVAPELAQLPTKYTLRSSVGATALEVEAGVFSWAKCAAALPCAPLAQDRVKPVFCETTSAL